MIQTAFHTKALLALSEKGTVPSAVRDIVKFLEMEISRINSLTGPFVPYLTLLIFLEIELLIDISASNANLPPKISLAFSHFLVATHAKVDKLSGAQLGFVLIRMF